MPILAAGLLYYRRIGEEIQVLLVHPGGPYFKNKDDGSWSIPKGEAEVGEDDLFKVAKREFCEETGHTLNEQDFEFVFVGSVKRKGGKTVFIWAFEGDLDERKIQSNMITLEWPPKSGRQIQIPEVDRGDWFSLEQARIKLVPYQVPILDSFEELCSQLRQVE